VPAPPNLGYYVCANGDRWSPGSPQTECIVSQLELFATRSLPSNYVPADGRVVSIAQYQLLYMRFGTAFGGDGESTLGIPNVPGPVAGTQYAMCADGYYPST
jgi:microcystin-dependent protein